MMRVLAGVPMVFVACGEPAGIPELLLPDDVRVVWDDAYNGVDDGLGALVPVDVMVYDSESGAPLANVTLQVWTDNDAAWALPVEAVGWASDVGGEDTGLLAWDANRDRFVAFDFDVVESVVVETIVVESGVASAYESDGVALETDADGIARLYLFVDAFPVVDADDGWVGYLGPVRATVRATEARQGTQAARSVEAMIFVAPF